MQEAADFAHGHLPPLFILADRIDDIADEGSPPYSLWSEGERELFWENCSEAFALLTTGVTYVVIPPNFPTFGDIWEQHEYPILAANPAVTEIIRVDSTDFDRQRSIWPCETYADAYGCGIEFAK